MTTLDQNTPLSAERRAEIAAKIERAHTEIGEVSSEGPSKRWRMHVPADPARDTDIILSDALTGAEVLLAEVDRLTAELGWLWDVVNGVGVPSSGLPDSEEVARLRQAVNAYQATLDRVATVPGITVGGNGETYEIVRRSDLNQALGLTADGKAVR